MAAVPSPSAAMLWVFASFLEDATPDQIPAAFRPKAVTTAAETTSSSPTPVVTTEPDAVEIAVVELVDDDEPDTTEATETAQAPTNEFAGDDSTGERFAPPAAGSA